MLKKKYNAPRDTFTMKKHKCFMKKNHPYFQKIDRIE